jgi:antitoxin ParD1/3/4
MPTRNVVLTERHQKIIDRLVRSGRYQNASEVLREGLRLVEQREAEDAIKLRALREAAQAGAKAFEQGAFQSFGSFDELTRHLEDATESALAEETDR